MGKEESRQDDEEKKTAMLLFFAQEPKKTHLHKKDAAPMHKHMTESSASFYQVSRFMSAMALNMKQ